MKTTFNIYFDGGTIGSNNSKSCDGYGSWEVNWNGFSKRMERQIFLQEFHHTPITNNVAEFLSLLAALDWLSTIRDKKNYAVEISGDSKLVLNSIEGSMKIKVPHIKILRDTCREYLSAFADLKITWRKRSHSVQRFGH